MKDKCQGFNTHSGCGCCIYIHVRSCISGQYIHVLNYMGTHIQKSLSTSARTNIVHVSWYELTCIQMYM